MSYEQHIGNIIQVVATTQEGQNFIATSAPILNKVAPPRNLNTRVNLVDLMQALIGIAKSPKDLAIMLELVEEMLPNNEIMIPNLTRFSELHDISIASFKRLLSRAEDTALLHKLNTGHYLVNPFVIASKGLTSKGNEAIREIQTKWSELTVMMTASDREALVQLSNHLGLEMPLPVNPFTLSVSQQYKSKGKITEGQKTALLK
jgi:hypothetical protein